MAVYKDKVITSDGRSWFYQYMLDGVLHKGERYLTKKEAKRAEAIDRLKQGKSHKRSFSIVAEAFFGEIESYRKKSSIQSYREVYDKHIYPFFGDFNLSSINIPKLKNFREKCLKMNYSTRYLNKINNVLNLILDYASKNFGYTNYNRVLGNYQEKKDKIVKEDIKYMTYEDYQKFISVINEIEWKTFFMFLYMTGMRLGEVLALQFTDLRGDSIIVNKTLYTKIKGTYTITSTKTNTNRVVKMDKSLITQLNEYIKYMQSFTDYKSSWFLFGGSKYLAPTTINRYKHKYFELANVPEITIHQFRHSHVSLLVNQYLKSGQTDSTKFFLMMSQRLGHSVDVMQRTYMHLFPQSQDDIVNILNNL